jgi:hypothetical protein
MPLRVVVIVEGHGEDAAIRPLFERIWHEHLRCFDSLEVIPWRGKQGKLLTQEGLRPVIEAAAIKLHAPGAENLRRLLLIMIDTEGKDCPKTKAPELIQQARSVRSDETTEIACVMPNVMFETWFAAAAESLRGKNDLPADLTKPADAEGEKLGKSWMQKHLQRKYKETVDQPRFAAAMSLSECEKSSRSFRKLVKVLRERVPTLDPTQEEPAAKEN